MDLSSCAQGRRERMLITWETPWRIPELAVCFSPKLRRGGIGKPRANRPGKTRETTASPVRAGRSLTRWGIRYRLEHSIYRPFRACVLRDLAPRALPWATISCPFRATLPPCVPPGSAQALRDPTQKATLIIPELLRPVGFSHGVREQSCCLMGERPDWLHWPRERMKSR